MEIKEQLVQKKLKSLLIPTRKSFEIKKSDIVDEENKVIRMKFSPFGNIDDDRDITIKGCFSKSINERGPQSFTHRKIKFLWQHDTTDPIGNPLLIEELEDGAYANVRLSNFDAVENSKRTYFQLLDGTLDQFSYGFNYIWDKMEYDENLDAFILKEVALHEISVVTFGANEMTSFSGIVEDIKELKSFIKGLKELNPDKYTLIKQFITELDGKPAEPTKSLTDNYLISSIAEKLIR